MNKLLAILAMAVLAACGPVPGAVAGEGENLPLVGVLTVEPEPVTITIELNGRVTPFLIAEVRPQVNGIILQRLFDEGSDVQRDAQLYQIDPAMFDAQLAASEAQLAKAYANVDVANAKLSRYEHLVNARAVNEQEYDEVEAAAKQAQAEVGIAESQVRISRINVEYAKVRSPISGRIGKSNVTQGALVTASQAQPLATVQQLDPIYVDVTQPVSSLLSNLNDNMAGFLENTGESHATMRLALDNGHEYEEEGHILFADVTVDQTTGSITLRAEFPNPNHTLLPGMYVRALVEVAHYENAITVPQLAVFREPDGTPYVMVVNANKEVEKRVVEAPRTTGPSWLITNGLKAGETLVIDGTQRVRFVPGQPNPRVNTVVAEDPRKIGAH